MKALNINLVVLVLAGYMGPIMYTSHGAGIRITTDVDSSGAAGHLIQSKSAESNLQVAGNAVCNPRVEVCEE